MNKATQKIRYGVTEFKRSVYGPAAMFMGAIGIFGFGSYFISGIFQ